MVDRLPRHRALIPVLMESHVHGVGVRWRGRRSSLRELGGPEMPPVILFVVNGDEWWLKPEWQEEHETREEWKQRTFAMNYGRRNISFSQMAEGLKELKGEKSDSNEQPRSE